MLLPVAMAMMWRAYPPERRARLARLVMIPILVAPAAAPVLGGLFVERLSWRWVFYVNVPVGLVALAFSAAYLVEHHEEPSGRFDLVGFVLAGGGLSLLLYAVSNGPLVGWGSKAVVASGISGIAALALFARIGMRRGRSALLYLGLVRDRLFRATNMVIGLSTASFLGILYLTPSFLQEARHQSPLSSGLTTFVEAIGVVLATQSVGRLYPYVGPRRMAGVGLTVLSASILAMTRIGPETSVWVVRALLCTAGAAHSTSFLAMQTAMFTTIAPADSGHAAAIMNAWRQSAFALGVAILSTVVSEVRGNPFVAFHYAYLAAAVMALLAALAALTLVHDVDAGTTMRRLRGAQPSRVADQGLRPAGVSSMNPNEVLSSWSTAGSATSCGTCAVRQPAPSAVRRAGFAPDKFR